MNSRAGLGVFLGAGAAAIAALFPLGLQHRIRHDGRERECAERLRTLQRLAVVRQAVGSCRGSLPPGGARWLALQQPAFALVGPADLPLFFCPYQTSPVVPGATDYRGPARRARGGGDATPVGADREENHPPCCPLNVILNDGSLRACPPGDAAALRDLLRP